MWISFMATFGSGRMDDNGWIGGMKKVGGNGTTPRKLTHTMFVHRRSLAPEVSALPLIHRDP